MVIHSSVCISGATWGKKSRNEKQQDEFQARKDSLNCYIFFKEDRFPKKREFIKSVRIVQYYCAEKNTFTNFLRLLFLNTDIIYFFFNLNSCLGFCHSVLHSQVILPQSCHFYIALLLHFNCFISTANLNQSSLHPELVISMHALLLPGFSHIHDFNHHR